MEAVATFEFNATCPTELSFRPGDRMLIMNYGVDDRWFNAEMDGQMGLVPDNYVDLKPVTWYKGQISRSVAERMLEGNTNVGAFLVRLSESSPSDFSLSVKCHDVVQHFRILRDIDHRKFSLWSTTFDSLNQLVDHYRTETVSRTSSIFLRDMTDDNQFPVEAIFPFHPTEDDSDELGFEKGDILTVFDSRDENWWAGRLGTNEGFFPQTYVKRI